MITINYILRHPRGMDYVSLYTDKEAVVWTVHQEDYKLFRSKMQAMNFWNKLGLANTPYFEEHVIIEKMYTFSKGEQQ